MTDKNEMLYFVKALSNADRLKIVGMLTRKPAGLTELAAKLALPPHQVSDHLAFLEQAGVVHQQDDMYSLDMDGLETLARRQLEGHRSSFSSETEASPDRQKVLAAFLNPDGTIRQIPNSRTQPARFRIILEYVWAAFEPGSFYTEKEVNSIILRFHPDVAGLRRDLVDAGMLARERDGSKYWLPGTEKRLE